MKKTLLSVFTAALLLGVQTSYAQDKGTHYGKEFNATKNAMDVPAFVNAIKDKNTLTNVTVKGTITQVCQAAGCWVKLKNDAGEDVFVKFQDGEITVPKDFSGKVVTVHGKGTKKTISIEQRRHFAEDAGASKEEIAKIDAPKQELRIDANGIIIH